MADSKTPLSLGRETPSALKFFKGRKDLIKEEKKQRSDYSFRQSLSSAAKEASEIVSRIRAEERLTIWKTEGEIEHELYPGMMFNVAKPVMENTKLWKIVRKLPKGSLLHTHLGASVDLEWVFKESLKTKGINMLSPVPLNEREVREGAVVRFQFSNVEAGKGESIWEKEYVPGTWVSMKEAAETFPDGGEEGFVAWMKDRCSITSDESIQHHLGVSDVWKKMDSAFIMLGRLVYYEPIMRAFLRKLFATLLEDGVRWVEPRTMFTAPFVLEGQEGPAADPGPLSRVLAEEIEAFGKSEEGKGKFWGARFIWTAMRWHDTAAIIDDMKHCIRIKKLYPSLIAGYDLVGQEDAGRTLHSLAPELLWFREACAAENLDIPFFFHAGECLGSGDSTDQNLYDAILFGTRRIGHAFSLYKHPLLISIVKDKNIMVESCPISNEVLRYTASIMSHPLPALLARGVPASLCNDDPAILGQGTSGMTHDFWQAVQGWEDLGLEGLGSLAFNSIRWSVFEDQTTEEWLEGIDVGEKGFGIKAKRMQEWGKEWEEFCEWVVREFGDLI